MADTAEQVRLRDCREAKVSWRKWGPYLSERQWGTVREDYSEGGDAWSYFSHDQARSRAYRWGEDGLGGISDDGQHLCFALALWNGEDSILKERLFGLTNSEGNHGEDVKEYYYYLDSTPTHSYMKYLYKYPATAFPYAQLVEINQKRGRQDSEYELIDTGVFDKDRYFDVFVEYAKETPEDILIRISVHNRGDRPAELHVLPTLWFRNEWSWGGGAGRPQLRELDKIGSDSVIAATSGRLGTRYLYCADDAPVLFTENETNTQRLFATPNPTPFVKDGINAYVVEGRLDAVNPQRFGTKASPHYRVTVPAGGEPAVLRLRLTTVAPAEVARAYGGAPFGGHFDSVMANRKTEADAFYAAIIPPKLGADAANVMRQALAGMLWSKQFYCFDVHRWLRERGSDPFDPTSRPAPRNEHWQHLLNAHVISMPDKWEYPWYAAWDLAFHTLALSLVDEDLGKQQLSIVLQETYLHPNGQIPAYEWNFGDVNPPVHAWAALFTYDVDKRRHGAGDMVWLKSVFNTLVLNFTWWVNRKDRHGKNVFEGGFLGLDNIGVFDRSMPLPQGGHLEQADGTAWMALFCLNMLDMAVRIAAEDVSYRPLALKFAEHFLWIASALGHVGGDTGMWDEEDGFFYDVLRTADQRSQRLKVRSMVGLLPLCAVTVFENDQFAQHPEFRERFRQFVADRPHLVESIHDPRMPGYADRRLGSVLSEDRLRRVLRRMLDEDEFLSPYGIRSLSRYHADHPYSVSVGGQDYGVGYLPAESDSGMFGGNSNWRGPIWMPVNALIIRALLHYYLYFGNDFTVECPTGSGRQLNLYQVAEELSRRLANIFLRDDQGERPVFGGSAKFQSDPHWKDHILFYEYFHGDNGAGIGASHQTGWTGIVARLMHFFATVPAETLLEK